MALVDNLISAWELNEATTGDAVDAHGTNTLTAVLAPGADAGFGRDFEDLTSNYFTIASNASLQTGDIDFTIWAEVRLESKGVLRVIASKDTSGGGHREYLLFFNNSADRFVFAVFRTADTGFDAVANTLGIPSLATSYHICAWHDATANTVNIQVNNGTVDSISVTGALQASGTSGFRIGARVFPGSESFYDGTIRRVRLWKRVLTTQEKTDLYNGGSGLAYSAFVAGGPAPGVGALVLAGPAAIIGKAILMPAEA